MYPLFLNPYVIKEPLPLTVESNLASQLEWSEVSKSQVKHMQTTGAHVGVLPQISLSSRPQKPRSTQFNRFARKMHTYFDCHTVSNLSVQLRCPTGFRDASATRTDA